MTKYSDLLLVCSMAIMLFLLQKLKNRKTNLANSQAFHLGLTFLVTLIVDTQ